MYSIHTTPGFIIGSRPYGDAGKTLSIFTRDFGLVTATAQGIRLERSKLRYYSQDFSFGEFSLVRGREFWRLTNASSSPSLVAQTSPRMFGDLGNSAARELIARIAMLLRRLLHGEEANPGLFDCVGSFHRFVSGNEILSQDRLNALESITVLRMLHALGYVGTDSSLDNKVESHELTTRLVDGLAGKREEMNRLINRALEASHL